MKILSLKFPSEPSVPEEEASALTPCQWKAASFHLETTPSLKQSELQRRCSESRMLEILEGRPLLLKVSTNVGPGSER